MPDRPYLVALFPSVHHALRAEKILRGLGLPHKLIPVPRHIRADCGISLRLAPEDREPIEAALTGQVEILEIRPL